MQLYENNFEVGPERSNKHIRISSLSCQPNISPEPSIQYLNVRILDLRISFTTAGKCSNTIEKKNRIDCCCHQGQGVVNLS